MGGCLEKLITKKITKIKKKTTCKHDVFKSHWLNANQTDVEKPPDALRILEFSPIRTGRNGIIQASPLNTDTNTDLLHTHGAFWQQRPLS